MALRPPIRVTMDDIPDDWHPMSRAAAYRTLVGRRLGADAAMMLTGADYPLRMGLALKNGGLGSLDPYEFTPLARAGMSRRFNPERQKVLDAIAKAKLPPKKPRVETQLDRDIRELRLEAERGRRFQVTNRDIGHPLTPVRRPAPVRERTDSQRNWDELRLRHQIQDDRIAAIRGTFDPRRRSGR